MTPDVRIAGTSTSLKLGQQNYLASGGEADLYKKGATVYKIYHSARPAHFASKLEWLKAHPMPSVAGVQDVLTNNQGETVGYAMPYTQGCTLGQMFPTPWQQRHRWTPLNTENVLRRMMDIISNAHVNGCVLVDSNEGNWLVQQDAPVAIDADSWQIPGHHANAILPSIQDPKQKHFDEKTDWFSFAIVSFMLWTGMHPYKGMHPKYGKLALADRMRDGVSVFDSQVKVPGAMRDLRTIPAGLSNWYEEVFSHSERGAPPSNWTKTMVAPSPTATPTGHLQGIEIRPLGISMPAIVRSLNQRWAIDASGKVIAWENPNVVLGHADHAKGPWFNGKSLPKSAYLQNTWVANGRVFNRNSESSHGLVEMQSFGLLGDEKWAVKTPWPCITQACHWFETSYAQTLLGATFIYYVDKQAGIHSIRTPWLNGMKIHALVSIDVDNHWVIYAPQNGGADYTLAHFDKTGHVLWSDQTESTHCSGVVLNNGVGVVCTAIQWFVTKGVQRKQWCPGVAFEYVLGTDDGIRVISEINKQKVQLTLK